MALLWLFIPLRKRNCYKVADSVCYVACQRTTYYLISEGKMTAHLCVTYRTLKQWINLKKRLWANYPRHVPIAAYLPSSDSLWLDHFVKPLLLKRLRNMIDGSAFPTTLVTREVNKTMLFILNIEKKWSCQLWKKMLKSIAKIMDGNIWMCYVQTVFIQKVNCFQCYN